MNVRSVSLFLLFLLRFSWQITHGQRGGDTKKKKKNGSLCLFLFPLPRSSSGNSKDAPNAFVVPYVRSIKIEIIFLWEPAALSFDWHEKCIFEESNSFFPRSSVHFLPPPFFFSETKKWETGVCPSFSFFPLDPRPPVCFWGTDGQMDITLFAVLMDERRAKAIPRSVGKASSYLLFWQQRV